MKKSTVISSIIFLIIIVIGGYFFYQNNIAKKSLGKINYGYEVWIGTFPYLVAYEKGYFKEQGLDVQLVKAESYAQEISDLLSGRTDFMGDFALVDVVKNVSLGNKLKVVLSTDYSNGGDGIVAKKEIENISELKGKKVAVEKDTLGEYLLYDALKKNNMTLADISEVNLTAQEAALAFIRGEVEVAVTYEPDLTLAVEKGDGWRLYTSAQSLGLIADALTFKADFLAENSEKVTAVVKAYTKAMDFILTNPQEAYLIGAKYFNITPVELEKQLLGIKLMTKDDNLNAFFYKTSIDSLHGAIIQANNFLLEKGTIKTKVDSTEILDSSFIKSLN
ncbi:MAG: ABC transporter substrate-binding protein [Candidatus Buchananbacteria bacterium]